MFDHLSFVLFSFYMQAAKSQESTEIDANADPEGNLVNIETQTPDGQKTETRSEEEKIHNQDPLPTDETQSHGFEFLTPEIEEPMDQSEDFVNVNLGDASSKLHPFHPQKC